MDALNSAVLLFIVGTSMCCVYVGSFALAKKLNDLFEADDLRDEEIKQISKAMIVRSITDA